MTASYDPTTSVGRIRLLITDTDTDDAIFSDEEIEAFLAMEGESILYAAALALRSIAISEALTQKRIRLLDLNTDGPATAAALGKLADNYCERAKKLEGDEEDAAFDIAEFAGNAFSYRERVRNEALRNL
jgi:hypothetical protein